MERPLTCTLGILLCCLATAFRLNASELFTHFAWSGSAIEVSRDYQNMRAWVDVFNIAIVTGIAVSLIGWLVPPRAQEKQ